MFTLTDALKELYIIKTREKVDLNELIDFSCDSDILKLMDSLEEHRNARTINTRDFSLNDIWDKVPRDRHIADRVMDMYDQGYSKERIEEYLSLFSRDDADASYER